MFIMIHFVKYFAIFFSGGLKEINDRFFILIRIIMYIFCNAKITLQDVRVCPFSSPVYIM